MSRYYCQATDVYRVDTEKEAKELIEESKKDNNFSLAKYSSEYKVKKQKGEIVDEYWKVTLTKVFNDIKEPLCDVIVTYNSKEGFNFS